MGIFKILNNQRGFSLIELMVVVAVIGILATIAIPNYQRFQRRAIQAEAKTGLAALYLAQQTFINEWGYGTTNFSLLGYDRLGESPYYVLGWHASDASEGTNKINDKDAADRASDYKGPPATAANESFVNSFAAGATTMAYGVPVPSAVALAMERVGTCTAPPSCTSCSGSYPTCGSGRGGSACSGSCTASANGVENTNRGNVSFTIGASGVINGETTVGGTSKVNVDAWTINNEKEVRNTRSAL